MSAFEFPGQAVDVYQTAHIRGMDGEQIVDEFAAFTQGRFNDAYREDEVQPLFIPARNEADDLPGTLLAAARSGDVLPVVLDNKSTDTTADIARRMGAIVVPVEEGNKMAATQRGFAMADELGARNLYFTDADTLVLPGWGGAMRSKLEHADQGAGSAVFGNSILWHGTSRLTDAVLSAAKLARGAQRQITGGEVVARGHNYAVRLDAKGQIANDIAGLDPNMFAMDDTAIRNTLVGSGAAVKGTISLSTTVVTRNDRVASLWQRMRKDYGTKRNDAYDLSYGLKNG